MSGIITTGTNPRALVPYVRKFHFLESQRYEPIYKMFYDEEMSKEKVSIEVVLDTLGLYQLRSEGQGSFYDSFGKTHEKQFVMQRYSSGFEMSMDHIIFNRYPALLKKYSRMLAIAEKETKEALGVAPFNDAFTGAVHTTYDGSALCASHSTASGHTNVNTRTVDLSELAFITAVADIENLRDERGLRVHYKPRNLVVTRDDWGTARKLVDSTLEPDTAHNAINVVNGRLAGKLIVHQYLENANDWFVTTDCPEGFKNLTAVPYTINDDVEMDSGNHRYRAYFYTLFDVMNYRSIWGSPGLA